MAFSDPATVAHYIDHMARQVPGVHALHRMTQVLLAERVPAEGRVLVLGAGGGAELDVFARAQPRWRFVGVDPSAEMLALAARTLGDAIDRVELVQGYIESAPQIRFDGATCLLTLHFLDREQRLRTLMEVRRRLQPGAPLVIAHHSVPDDAEQKRTWFRRWAAFGQANGLEETNVEARVELIAHRLPTLDPRAEETLLREAGFRQPELFYAAFTFRGWVVYA